MLDLSSIHQQLGVVAIDYDWNSNGYSVSCADCHTKVEVVNRLSGHPAVPGAVVAHFCNKCFKSRLSEYNFEKPPTHVRPLGQVAS